MPAPAVVAKGAAVAARSRTGRRVILVLLVLVLSAVLAPFLLTGAAVAGVSIVATAGSTGGGEPGGPITVSGDWAIPLSSYSFTSGYGPRECDGCSKFHEGVDLASSCGDVVHSASSGVVISAGPYQRYGNTVRVDHGGGVSTLYAHMMWGSLRVEAGQTVEAGTPLGLEGNTGQSFGCHVHFEVRLNGAPVNPAPFMAARGLPLV